MATQACTEDTRALPVPILEVNTLREAHLRISWLVALVCLVALSGLLAALWEVSFGRLMMRAPRTALHSLCHLQASLLMRAMTFCAPVTSAC